MLEVGLLVDFWVEFWHVSELLLIASFQARIGGYFRLYVQSRLKGKKA